MRRCDFERTLIEGPDPELWEAPWRLSVDEAREQVGEDGPAGWTPPGRGWDEEMEG